MRGARRMLLFYYFHYSFSFYRPMIEIKDIIAYAEEFLKESPEYLVDVAITPNNIITVEIDNDEGVDLDRCIALSRYIDSKLDREIEDFELTVTSAGLTSPLKTKRQYKKYIGKEVEVLSKEGLKQYGVLKESNNDKFKIEVSKMERPEGAKRKTEVIEEVTFGYDEIKYTKYKIRF